MDRIVRRRRIFDPHRGLQIAAGEVVLDAGKAVRGSRRRLDVARRSRGRRGTVAAEGAAIFDAWRNGSMTAAIHADGAAVVEKIGAGRDVDETDRAQPEFGRQGADDQGHGADKAGVENAAEAGEPVGQHHPVDAELDVGVVVADMQQAAGGGILRDPGGLQQHSLDRLIVALGEILDGLVADRIGGRADGRVQIAACLIEDAVLCGKLRGRRNRRRRRGGRRDEALRWSRASWDGAASCTLLAARPPRSREAPSCRLPRQAVCDLCWAAQAAEQHQ